MLESHGPVPEKKASVPVTDGAALLLLHRPHHEIPNIDKSIRDREQLHFDYSAGGPVPSVLSEANGTSVPRTLQQV